MLEFELVESQGLEWNLEKLLAWTRAQWTDADIDPVRLDEVLANTRSAVLTLSPSLNRLVRTTAVAFNDMVYGPDWLTPEQVAHDLRVAIQNGMRVTLN